jgi:hypothetical protein
MEEPMMSAPEEAVLAEAIPTLRKLLRILAPHVVGYELRALPLLTIEAAERVVAERDRLRNR